MGLFRSAAEKEMDSAIGALDFFLKKLHSFDENSASEIMAEADRIVKSTEVSVHGGSQIDDELDVIARRAEELNASGRKNSALAHRAAHTYFSVARFRAFPNFGDRAVGPCSQFGQAVRRYAR